MKELKRFQDTLGDANDFAVHAQVLRTAAEELSSGGAPEDVLLAIGAWTSELERRRRKARRRFEEFLQGSSKVLDETSYGRAPI